MAGRKSKLTPERQQKIVELVAAGNYQNVAAHCVGIDETTLSRWLKMGSEQSSGPYYEFRQALKEAEAQSEAVRIERIATAGQTGNWQADAWYLERRYPDRWARRERQDLTLKGSVEHSLDSGLLDIIQRLYGAHASEE